MKKIVLILLVLLLASSVYAAEGMKSTMVDEEKGNADMKEKGQETGTGEEVATEEMTQNMGEESMMRVTNKVQNVNELKASMESKKQAMNEEMENMMGGKGLDADSQKMYQNQNTVRLAVHSLLAMEGMVGGIGKQVSEIAKGFDNSVQSTIKSEEKVQKRSGFARFFAGGDHEAAEEIEKEVNQNKEKIQELKQLKDQCECGSEVKEMFQEQIQNMEQEQNRLGELAETEKGKKGLFGWIWK